jgi:site-specific DNA-methyltransferase (adenine-specific)
MKTNVLYYGDNLEILRKYIPDNSIDLIYLDPPFSSKKDYNIIFREPTGKQPEAQIKAFKDTWHWDRAAEDSYQELIINGPPEIARLIAAMCDKEHGILDHNDVAAYVVMMTARLLELHRVLKDTGSLYLHCDPTASHYLKLVMDQIFEAKNFRNEIVWAYTRPGTKQQRQFPRTHDIIFWYSKGNETWAFNPDSIRIPYAQTTLDRGKYSVATSKVTKGISKRVLPSGGKCPEDWWQIPMIQGNAKERLGYPTQKPEALLERIIKASSNEGDIVLDPFCGCGTALVAAQKLNRRWIGIDITHLAINVMKKRLQDSFPGIQFEVVGEPKDFASACELAQQNRYQFQWWALSLISAKPLGEKRKGADKGIDGVIDFIDNHGDKARRAVVQVKSGHVSVKDIRELKSIVEQNAMGIFITLTPPTREMQKEAVAAGYYHSPLYNRDYPKIQILTIEELLQGKKVDMPPTTREFFPKAPRISKREGEQLTNL